MTAECDSDRNTAFQGRQVKRKCFLPAETQDSAAEHLSHRKSTPTCVQSVVCVCVVYLECVKQSACNLWGEWGSRKWVCIIYGDIISAYLGCSAFLQCETKQNMQSKREKGAMTDQPPAANQTPSNTQDAINFDLLWTALSSYPLLFRCVQIRACVVSSCCHGVSENITFGCRFQGNRCVIGSGAFDFPPPFAEIKKWLAWLA